MLMGVDARLFLIARDSGQGLVPDFVEHTAQLNGLVPTIREILEAVAARGRAQVRHDKNLASGLVSEQPRFEAFLNVRQPRFAFWR